MEESKKKPIMIGVVLACLVLAGLVTYINRPKKFGIDSIKKGENIWVKCSNPDCGTEYQMEKKGYFKYIQEHMNPMSMTIPPLVCKKCGEKSIYRALKCEKCEAIFFYGEVPDDFPDRCPKCGYSKTEEVRKKAKAAKQQK